MVERHAATVSRRAETVDLVAGLGRVLAEGILADRDFPPFDRAARDGYAVRAADLAEFPARLEVVGEVKAGDWPDPGLCSVGRGQAVGIMTGAPLPAGADAVVMVEHTSVALSSHPKLSSHPNVAQNATLGRTLPLARLDRTPLDRAPLARSSWRFYAGFASARILSPRGAEALAGQLLLDRGTPARPCGHRHCSSRRQEPRAGLSQAARRRALYRRRGGGG